MKNAVQGVIFFIDFGVNLWRIAMSTWVFSYPILFVIVGLVIKIFSPYIAKK